jgi:hypothetical protein
VELRERRDNKRLGKRLNEEAYCVTVPQTNKTICSLSDGIHVTGSWRGEVGWTQPEAWSHCVVTVKLFGITSCSHCGLTQCNTSLNAWMLSCLRTFFNNQNLSVGYECVTVHFVARFLVFMVVRIQVFLWVVMPCGVAVRYQCSGGPCFLYLQVEVEGPPKHRYPTAALHSITT